ncbi:MAG: GNAT family N-acetyltransferase [Bacilli bacterium]|nr:GNAT family N-acetyltransferase [Bacilli bacterium]
MSQFIVYNQDIPVGYLQTSSRVAIYKQYPNTISLICAVLPEHRRKEYGTKIVKETMDYAFNNGAVSASLCISPWNERGKKIANKLDFHEVNNRDHIYVKVKS